MKARLIFEVALVGIIVALLFFRTPEVKSYDYRESQLLDSIAHLELTQKKLRDSVFVAISRLSKVSDSLQFYRNKTYEYEELLNEIDARSQSVPFDTITSDVARWLHLELSDGQ